MTYFAILACSVLSAVFTTEDSYHNISHSLSIYGNYMSDSLSISKDIIRRSLSEPVIINGNFIKRVGLYTQKYSIPKGVDKICKGSLMDMCRIDTLIITEGVKCIEERSICVKDKVFLPNSLLTLSADAFWESGLTSLEIPLGVCSITYSGVTSQDTRPGWEFLSVHENNAYYDSRNDCNAVICSASGTLIMGCRNTIIPESVTEIGRLSFSYCQKLKNIIVPKGVHVIADSAFLRCYDLVRVVLSDDIEYIADEAFSCCWSLSKIGMPMQLKEIGYGAFAGCSLTTIRIPENVTKIGEMAFSGNSKLKKIVVDKKNDCYKSFHGKAVVETGTRSLIVMRGKRVPSGITRIASGASSQNNEIHQLVIPEGVISIGREAFCSCSQLQKVIIPETLSLIDEYAFGLCYHLKDVYNYSTIPQQINENVFSVYGVLHVKNGYKDVYLNANNWNRFTIIDDL